MDITINNHNKVSARGRNIFIGQNDYGYKSVMLSIRGRDRKREVRVSFVLGTDLPSNVTMHSFVKIEGYVNANVYKNDVWNRSSYIQYFVADKIELDKTQLEEAFPEDCKGRGFAYARSFVNVALKGEIVKLTKSEDKSVEGTGKSRVWTRITLRVDPVKGKNRPSLVHMQYSSNMRVNDLSLNVGDKVCVVAIVSSKSKQSENVVSRKNSRQHIKYFEDIIVDDIAIIEPSLPKLDPEDVKKMLMEDEAMLTNGNVE